MKKEKLTFHELEKLAEQLATLKSENRSLFQTLFTDNRTIHLIIDKETSTIAKANKAACNFYGYLTSPSFVTRGKWLNVFNA